MLPEYKIYVGADHRGFQKKAELLPILEGCHPNVKVVDMGAKEYKEDDDFNDPAIDVSLAVLGQEHSFGVLICGSAHGVTMQANRIRGIRAMNCLTPESAVIGKQDDYANVLCLSADALSVAEMDEIIKAFCHTAPKTDERYQRRVNRLDEDIDASLRGIEFKIGIGLKHPSEAADGVDESEEE